MRPATLRELMLVCIGGALTAIGVIANTIYTAMIARDVAELRTECSNGTQ